MYAMFTADPAASACNDIIHVLTAQLAVYTRFTEEQGRAAHARRGRTAQDRRSAARSSGPERARAAPSGRGLCQPRRAATHLPRPARRRDDAVRQGPAVGHALRRHVVARDVPVRHELPGTLGARRRQRRDVRARPARRRCQPCLDLGAVPPVPGPRLPCSATSTRPPATSRMPATGSITSPRRTSTRRSGWCGTRQSALRVGIGAALRDVAAATADHSAAHAARAATEDSLAFVPVHVRPATVLLALRLADCYACVGQPEAAAAIATPVLAEAVTTRWPPSATSCAVSAAASPPAGRTSPDRRPRTRPELTSGPRPAAVCRRTIPRRFRPCCAGRSRWADVHGPSPSHLGTVRTSGRRADGRPGCRPRRARAAATVQRAARPARLAPPRPAGRSEDQPLHGLQPRDVGQGAAPVRARTAARRAGAVPAVPRAQGGGGHTEAVRHAHAQPGLPVRRPAHVPPVHYRARPPGVHSDFAGTVRPGCAPPGGRSRS